MTTIDDEAYTPLAFWPGNPATPPDQERLRQAFSNISLICDHLDHFEFEYPYTSAQRENIKAAYEHLRTAHRLLKTAAQNTYIRSEVLCAEV